MAVATEASSRPVFLITFCLPYPPIKPIAASRSHGCLDRY
jgi:hypothetical protein